MTSSFIFMFLSALALPLLALLALLLRRELFQGKWKIVMLIIGTALLGLVVVKTFREHGEDITWIDILISAVTALITLSILSRFSHGHTHSLEENGAKGIVISEAFHSLLDGAVIGATYLVNPVVGYAATVGILIHELPKIIGTLALFRGIGFSIKKTVLYGLAAQIGSPVSAILIFTLGKHINEEQFHALEIASISSLGAIVLWIIYLEICHHRDSKHTHRH